MNTQQIQEIIETAKTWNINLDSESSIELVNSLVPVLKLFVLKELFIAVSTFALGVIAILAIVVVITKIIRSIEKEEKASREERNK